MVTYKIGICNRKDTRVIELDKIIKIKNLDKLDEFTSNFANQNELKMYLLNQGLIFENEINDYLNIIYKINGEIREIPIIYKKMQKYLDIFYLKNKIIGASQNIDLLEKLTRHYSMGSDKFNPQGVNIRDIKIYLNSVRSNGGNHFYSRSLEIALYDMWEKAVFKPIAKDPDEKKQTYRGTRDLGMFLYKYEKELEEQKMNQETNKDESSETKYEREPDFPPNSEEEMKYIIYLEELSESNINQTIENHPHYRR